LNHSAKPWEHLNQPPAQQATKLVARACTPLTANNPSSWWYESITHNGQSSFMSSSYKSNYKVFRNVVTDYGADRTGATSANVAIQNAIQGKSQ
jgi:glucan 1,3-beta-glucosidase